jgi:hypothetical protein
MIPSPLIAHPTSRPAIDLRWWLRGKPAMSWKEIPSAEYRARRETNVMPVLLKPHTKLRNIEGLREVMNSTIGLRRNAKLMGDGVRSVRGCTVQR